MSWPVDRHTSKSPAKICIDPPNYPQYHGCNMLVAHREVGRESCGREQSIMFGPPAIVTRTKVSQNLVKLQTNDTSR